MYQIKKFDIGSVAIISFILFSILGFMLAIPFSFFGYLISSLSPSSVQNESSSIFGLLFIIILPIFYGIAGTIMNVIMAAIYNIIANKMGGLKIELVKLESIVDRVADIEAT